MVEDLLKKSGLESIVLRPAGLSDGPRTGKYQVNLDVSGGRISRADVADCII